MARTKEEKIIISKDAALQIVDKEECEKLLNAVRNSIERTERIIKRRNTEVSNLKEIQNNLATRLDFLTISDGKIEPCSWYKSLKGEEYAYVTDYAKSAHTVCCWEFPSFKTTKLSRGWRGGQHVFFSVASKEIILEPPQEGSYTLGDNFIKIQYKEVGLRGAKSFLTHWTPSNDLGVVVSNPEIIEAKGILDDFIKTGHKQRIKHLYTEDDPKTTIQLAKYQGQWWFVMILEGA